MLQSSDDWKNVSLFTIVGKVQHPENDWIGIGFNRNKTMKGTDIILGFYQNGKGVVKHFYAEGYEAPKEVESQYISSPTLRTLATDFLFLEFKRTMKTSDEVSISISGKCMNHERAENRSLSAKFW